MFGSLRVARIIGIDIEINLSWLAILALLAWTLSDSVFPDQYDGWSRAAYWVVGTTSAVLLFVTVLIHELAHAIVAKRRGLDVPRITLFIFGGVSHMSRQPQTPGEEFAIAAAGPATSVVVAGVSLGGALLTMDWNEKVSGIFFYLGTVNVMLAVFNILPGFPLDGGRVLRSIAWKRMGSFRGATRVASGVGEMFGYGLLLLGATILLSGYALNGLWFMFIGWFLLNAARAEAGNMQLESILGRLTAGDVMHREFELVKPGMSLQEVVDDHMLARGERAVIVANDGAVRGLLTVSDIRKVPREAWPHTPVQGVMTPRERVTTVTVTAKALDVLRVVSENRFNQVPVLDDGQMVGIITRRELLDRLQLAESLAPDSGGESPPP
ncbi:MAG: protease [Anaerolinea sp.]|nr:protease [Anaerolinea sp.]